MIIHVVSSGETLWQISNRYAVSMSSIVQINDLQNPNQLVVGQALVIPKPGTTHIVKYGETLWSIAQKYGVSISAIVQSSNLTNPNLLYPGTTLYIPAITHIVQPGEALWQIANRYGTTVQAIINENQITNPNLIYPGLQLAIPRTKPAIEVNAYTYQPSAGAVQTLNEIGHLLTYFSPFAYLIAEDGTLNPVKNDEEMVKASLSKNVVPMMSVTNFTSTQAGSNVAHTILATPEIRDKVLTNILQVMDSKGYKGVNIDFENVLPADREVYNQFLQLAVDRLHPKGYFVSTALAPKVGATQAGLLYEAHDYEAHGRIADFVVLMTYEWGYRLGPPQAISPINEMKRVVEYALSVMPADKIFLGFQIYARDWKIPHVKGQEAETFSPQEALRRAVKYGAAIQYDATTQSPFFRYVDEKGQGHEVWFEDARSAQAKFNMVKDYNLRGISYWALGYPYPENWALLRDNFSIKKLM
ncbi:spore gernimation protein [Bacillus sp. AFS073361]|uniref:LysM peptidoglycan-binding domain-containing protein n=1 Tax=Bacillus sp. AFS073361 TaxID=2033511 RepID=UPI000BF9B10F|nr:LysM peptidoglycan-binding domain-containing protein [Bacillus sp. AFS073361]PFP22722.1 spore gernimation protein [Bacillus sp. AFS073361]